MMFWVFSIHVNSQADSVSNYLQMCGNSTLISVQCMTRESNTAYNVLSCCRVLPPREVTTSSISVSQTPKLAQVWKLSFLLR